MYNNIRPIICIFTFFIPVFLIAQQDVTIRASYLIQQQNYNEAIDLLRPLINDRGADDKNEERLLLALALEGAGDFAAAVVQLQAAIETIENGTDSGEESGRTDSMLSFYYFNLANNQMKMDQYPAAIASLDKTTQLAPDDSSAYYNRAACYLRLSEYDRALADYRQFVSMTENEENPYRNRTLGIISRLEDMLAARDQLAQLIEKQFEQLLNLPAAISLNEPDYRQSDYTPELIYR